MRKNCAGKERLEKRYLELLCSGGLAISIADLHIIGLLWGRGLPKLLPKQVDVGLDEQVALAAPGRIAIKLDALRINLYQRVSRGHD